MNYLAHIYLSGSDQNIMIGNFIADSIKGSKYLEYPIAIQKGILLHRKIDSFTDHHPSFRNSTKKLHQRYGHYSGIIVDIFYDHFLAKNWNDYSKTPLEKYIAHFYDILLQNQEILPLSIQKMMPYMIESNWLLSYSSVEGITRVLKGMNKRTKHRSGMDTATDELQLFYDQFYQDFKEVFKDLKQLSSNELGAN